MTARAKAGVRRIIAYTSKGAFDYLRSRDTVHGFYVPEFNFSRYAQPGVLNQFDFTVAHAGVYRAQCTQFCGLYHADMLFSVKVVPPAQFQAWLSTTQAAQAAGTSA